MEQTHIEGSQDAGTVPPEASHTPALIQVSPVLSGPVDKGDFIGDWKVTSTADWVASRKGWFHVTKAGAHSIFQ